MPLRSGASFGAEASLPPTTTSEASGTFPLPAPPSAENGTTSDITPPSEERGANETPSPPRSGTNVTNAPTLQCTSAEKEAMRNLLGLDDDEPFNMHTLMTAMKGKLTAPLETGARSPPRDESPNKLINRGNEGPISTPASRNPTDRTTAENARSGNATVQGEALIPQETADSPPTRPNLDGLEARAFFPPPPGHAPNTVRSFDLNSELMGYAHHVAPKPQASLLLDYEDTMAHENDASRTLMSRGQNNTQRPTQSRLTINAKIPSFTGERGESPMDFLIQLKKYRTIMQASETDFMTRVIPEALDGKAARWFDFTGDFETFEQFTGPFNNQYEPTDYAKHMREAMYFKGQGPDEPMTEFIHVMNLYFKRLYPQASEQEKVNYVIERLHPDFHDYFRNTRFENLRQLANAAGEAQSRLLAKNTYTPPRGEYEGLESFLTGDGNSGTTQHMDRRNPRQVMQVNRAYKHPAHELGIKALDPNGFHLYN